MEATIVGLLPLQLGRLLVWGEALPIHVMVYGRFERGRPRSGRSRVRFVLFWCGCCLHALENRRAWPTNAGRSAEDSRGSGLLRLAPTPGVDGPPLGGPRDGRTARTSTGIVIECRPRGAVGFVSRFVFLRELGATLELEADLRRSGTSQHLIFQLV